MSEIRYCHLKSVKKCCVFRVAVTAAGGLLPGGDIVAHYVNEEVIEPEDPITIGQPVHFKCDDPTHYLVQDGQWFLEITLALFDDGSWNGTQPTACVGMCLPFKLVVKLMRDVFILCPYFCRPNSNLR